MSSNCNVFFVDYSLETAIINVKRLYHCSINEINNFYVDSEDHNGLFFWNDDAIKYQQEIEKNSK